MSEEPNAFRERLTLLVPLNNLQPRQQEQVLASAEILTYRKRDHVFRQGDRDQYAFYLLSGELEMWSGDQLIKKVVGGEAASFQPLAQLQPRQMSAVALGPAQCLRVDRNLLDRLLSVGSEDASSTPADAIEVTEYEAVGSIDWLTSMLQSDLFARIPPSHLQRLIDILESVEVKAGQEIIRQGSAGDYYYIIQSGRCEVCRATRLGKEIRLAELGPGETFGEEALVSNAKRNATVRMLTDGVLGRLTQAHFLELISEPVLKRFTLAEATQRVAAGARWLDVRFPEEHRANGIPGSLNVPLSLLRARLKDLPATQRYVAYCDSGGRSSAAAFLMAQEGFDVGYVANGAINELDADPNPTPLTTSPPAQPPAVGPAARDAAPAAPDLLVDAEVKAQTLAAEVERARIQIEQAERLMAEANAAKLAAEQIVEQRLEQERARLAEEAQQVHRRLEEAQRLKLALEQQQLEAAADAARQREAQEARAEELRREIARALAEKEQRLEAVYRDQAAQLEQLQAEQAKARKTLDDTWQQIEMEASMSKERLAAAMRLEQETRAREKAHADALAAREQTLREALKAELAQERQRFEAEFAKSAAEIARARQEQQAAEAAKSAAAEEAQRIIAEYAAQQQRQFAEMRENLRLEREAILAEAERLREEMTASLAARDAAEAARRAIEQELRTTQQRQASSAQTEAELRAEIAALQARAASATRDITAAIEAAAVTADRQRENAARLERTYSSDTELSAKLRQELDDWVVEQERIQNSTAQRAELQRRMAMTARIRERATAAKRAAEQQEFSLLDEIASKLGEEFL